MRSLGGRIRRAGVHIVVGGLLTGFVLAPVELTQVGPASASQTDCLSYGYGCTPGYDGSNASGTWAWAHYGGSYAVNANGYHNCTLYAAWRLAENGMPDPGNWGNAASWASYNGGGNHIPAVGSIAWWGSEVDGGYGHVAYVDQVNGSMVHVVADNYVGPNSNGYTDSGWIAASSVDAFLHPHDMGGPAGFRADFQANTGNLYTDDSATGAADLQQGMMSGTNPSITALASGGYETAFQANTGNLIVYGDGGNVDTGQGMMRGTSPSIAASPGGSR